MYRLGRRGHAKTKKHTWRIFVIVGVIVLLVASVVAFVLLRDLEAPPTVPQSVTREFSDQTDNTDRPFTQAGFTISLPSDWVIREENAGIYGRYSFQATAKNADNRWLDVYIDKIPTDLAVNRLLPVTTVSGKIIVSGSVSDNCVSFNTSDGVTPDMAGQSMIIAKWQEIDFLCDMANTVRNLVGVGTTDNENKIILTSTSGEEHQFYFVYTDHNIHPDYQIFERALESVTLP